MSSNVRQLPQKRLENVSVPILRRIIVHIILVGSMNRVDRKFRKTKNRWIEKSFEIEFDYLSTIEQEVSSIEFFAMSILLQILL